MAKAAKAYVLGEPFQSKRAAGRMTQAINIYNERLRAALNKALALCRYCDGTGTVVIAYVETGEQIGAENCEKCWPLRSPNEQIPEGGE